ncbi:hypothetical protein ACV22V_30390 [Burkholderia sp. AW33-5]
MKSSRKSNSRTRRPGSSLGFCAAVVCAVSMAVSAGVSAQTWQSTSRPYRVVSEWAVSSQAPTNTPANGLPSTLRVSVADPQQNAQTTVTLGAGGQPDATLVSQPDQTYRGKLATGEDVIVATDPVYGLYIDVNRGQWTRSYYRANNIVGLNPPPANTASLTLANELATANVVSKSVNCWDSQRNQDTYFLNLVDDTNVFISGKDWTQFIALHPNIAKQAC